MIYLFIDISLRDTLKRFIKTLVKISGPLSEETWTVGKTMGKAVFFDFFVI